VGGGKSPLDTERQILKQFPRQDFSLIILNPQTAANLVFTDVNLSHAMQISDSLQVKAQIENLLDRSVQYSFAGTTQQRF
jgi:outer membrane cobalamin receptor